MFNVTAFDNTTMQWMVVCRVRVTSQSQEAYCLCFQKMFNRCKADKPEFELGENLVGIVVDWSDAQCKGLKLAIGDELSERLLRGCEVHWHRSYQRVCDKVWKQQHLEKRRIEKQAFQLAASAITLNSRSSVSYLSMFMWRKEMIRSEIYSWIAVSPH